MALRRKPIPRHHAATPRSIDAPGIVIATLGRGTATAVNTSRRSPARAVAQAAHMLTQPMRLTNTLSSKLTVRTHVGHASGTDPRLTPPAPPA